MAYSAYFGISDRIWVRCLLIAISLGLSYLSYHFIETPIRRRKIWSRPVAMLWLFLLYAISSILIGGIYYRYSGFPENWNGLASKFMKSRRISAYQEKDDVDLSQQRPRGVTIGASGSKLDFIVWGDSHARAMIPLLSKLGQDYNKTGLQITSSGTPAIFGWAGMSSESAKKWRLLVEEQTRVNPGVTIYLISRWHSYQEPQFWEKLRQTLSTLNKSGARVVLVEEVPEQPSAPPRLAALATRFPYLPTPFSTPEAHLRVTSEVKRRLDQIDTSKLLRLDPSPTVFDWGSTMGSGEVYYADSNHLSISGAMKLEGLFRPLFQHPL